MLILGLIETMGQLAMANSVRWYGHELRSEDGRVLRQALDCDVEGQWKKGWPTTTCEKQVEEEIIKVGMSREDALCRSKWIADINQITTRLR